MKSIASIKSADLMTSRVTLGCDAFHRHRLRNGLFVFHKLDLEEINLFAWFGLFTGLCKLYEKSDFSLSLLTERGPSETYVALKQHPTKKNFDLGFYEQNQR